MGTNIGIGNYIGKSKPQGSFFHPSLVDYWNFKGKSNSDKDRNTIKGIKGNILNAYNFGWSLRSGYGLYDFYEWITDHPENCVIDKNYVTIDNTVGNPSGFWLSEVYNLSYATTLTHPSFEIEVTGLGGQSIDMIYHKDNVQTTIKIKDGINNIPVSSIEATEGKYIMYYLFDFYGINSKITIRQIPEHEGAIVTDGVDDYLKLDKVGYKIGTVIIKAIPLIVGKSGYIFDVERERTYFSYLLNPDNTIRSGFSFNSKKVYGNYDVLRYNDDNIANIYTPMFIGCRFNINEYISMALYEIAIYQDILTEEQVLAEIDKMNKL